MNRRRLPVLHGPPALFDHDPETGPTNSPRCHPGCANQYSSTGLGASPGSGVLGIGLIGRHDEGTVGPDCFGNCLLDGYGLVGGGYHDHQGLT
jgi:hypothetical protein